MAQVIANAARSYSVGVNREVDDNGAVVWDYDQVKKLTKGIDRGNILLVDVREVDEVQQGNIPTSINLSVKSLQEALSLSELQFQDKYGFEKPPKEQEIVFYCRSGKRSTAATAIAKAAGYKNLGNYTGSWLDWASKSQGSN
ncbi:Rhodanese-like protein [Saitoella complicata NRRL Y-17804]|uniref:Rhodanese-like protein n=1 Tax=Saitoella complicata (strain BCRC 22490 / CBS 7301 / JCM 7358 / NBRC 10748 / NRRL Y-17804) TaxID=698492 RepID=UPI000867E974|nr:Rhodanese-like protein [Saitoella complicata NRRL Y-17804]ODQ55659.1 Rhodanese-like protein [Saitoella complicata NRRL Y-17804]